MDGKASVLFEEGGAVASILAVADMGVFFKPGGQHSTMGTSRVEVLTLGPPRCRWRLRPHRR
jgi:hypothetical protein